MSHPRIFVTSKLSSNQKIILDLSISHRILQVLRLRINDQLTLFNDAGGEFSATLISVDKQRACVTVGDFIARNNESPLPIHLGQGISRGEKMDFTIQKAVELGVSTITPLFTKYCNVKLQDERLTKRLQHWQQVAISAAEQSGRCYVPKILPAQTVDAWCSSAGDLRLLLDPIANNKIGDIKEQPKSVAILVGPEGGLSDEEILVAKQYEFLGVALGPRILRTETAALTAISMLQAKWGDF